MILEQKTIDSTGKSPNDCAIRSKIWLKCDYCNCEFERVKKSISRLNSIINKDSCGSKECTLLKKKEISLKKYGTEHMFQSENFKKSSAAKTKLLYGESTYLSSVDFQEKRKKKLIERYGVDSPLKADCIKNKVRDTCLDKYGTDNPSKNKKILEKRNSNNLAKYGVEHPVQLNKVKDKSSDTSVKKYGKKSYTQTDKYWIERKITCVNKYGVEHPHQNKKIRQKMTDTIKEKYGVDSYSKTQECKDKFKETCMKRYGVSNPLMLAKNRLFGKKEQELKDWINSFGCCFEKNMSILGDRELDLYDNSLKIAIEYCGLYWHTELSASPKYKHYHNSKRLRCLKRNVRLFTVFDDEWLTRKKQCQNFLLASLGKYDKSVFARKCLIKEIDHKNCREFCEENHIQGRNNNQTIFACGLFYENKLIGAMSLARHHRFAERCVLDRLCFANGIQVVGGASKLFRMCVNWAKDHKIFKIISWSDNRWSLGKVYDQMGFQLAEELPPDYSYVDMKKPIKRISKQSQQKKKCNCPENLTESEWAKQRGLARIWDCGKKRWEYNI